MWPVCFACVLMLFLRSLSGRMTVVAYVPKCSGRLPVWLRRRDFGFVFAESYIRYSVKADLLTRYNVGMCMIINIKIFESVCENPKY